ncbi:MAG: hypothetical protein U0V87_04795 [Acidobacteriota bacterium]
MNDLVEQTLQAALEEDETGGHVATLSEYSPPERIEEPRLLLDSLRNVLRSLQRLELFEFEERSNEDLRRRLVPFIERGARLSTQLIGRLLDYYRDRGSDDAVDVCVVARVQVSANTGALLEVDDALETLSHCNRLRGAVIAAIMGVDDVVSATEGWPLAERVSTGVPTGITARRAYARFRAGLRALEHDDSLDVTQRLQRAIETIQTLVTPPLGKRLRVGDRLQLRRAQRQVEEWFAQESRDEQDALGHWSNLQHVAELLMMINHRHELVVHDRTVLERCDEILRNTPPLNVDHTLVTALSSLHGRDPELDHWIAILEEGVSERLGTVIQRVLASNFR